VNYQKRLIELLRKQETEALVLTHKDRLHLVWVRASIGFYVKCKVSKLIIHKGDQPTFEKNLPDIGNYHCLSASAILGLKSIES